MINCLSNQPPMSDRTFTYDSASEISSNGLRKIFRKPNQSTASRRSLSRRSSSEKSLQKPQVQCFFIKMSSMESTQLNNHTTSRNNILTRDENRNQKKRSPTPVPGFLSRKRQTQKQNSKKEEDLEKEIELVELQTKLVQEKEKVNECEKKIGELQKDLETKKKQIQQLSELLVKSEERQKDLNKKTNDYRNILTQNETTLCETKNKLQRLKNTIKINRYSQLQLDNAKLRKQKEKMMNKISQLECQNKDVEERCAFLEKQIFKLKKTSDNKFPRSPSGQKNENLQKVLISRDEYSKKLEAKVGKLEIKLNILNRKKIQELQQLKQKKDKELYRLRTRLLNLNKELTESRKLNMKLKITDQTLCESMQLKSRSSLMSSDTWATHEDIFCLSLSPQHLQC